MRELIATASCTDPVEAPPRQLTLTSIAFFLHVPLHAMPTSNQRRKTQSK